MIYNEIVHGSQPKKPLNVEFNVDTVYVRNDIHEETIVDPIDESRNRTEWVYEEYQYTYPEYQKIMNEKIDTNKDSQDEMNAKLMLQVAKLSVPPTK